jgi:hypothetical protein
VLDVQLSETVTSRGISALRQLTSLEEFIYDVDIWNSSLLASTYRLLPHLHVAAIKPEPIYTSKTGTLSDVCSIALEEIRSRCTLHLHHLALPNLYQLPRHVALPEVRVLYLLGSLDSRWDEFEELPFVHLPRLAELYLEGANNYTVLKYIVVHGFGQQLQTLRVSVPYYNHSLEKLPLDEVLAACPNLTELSVTVRGLESATELRPDTLRCLSILRIEFIPSNENFTRNWQPGLVLQVLRLAPELRCVEICSDMLQTDDLEILKELVEERACLRHLQRLLICVYAETPISKKLLDLFVISCCNHCEQLSEVFVGEDLYTWSKNVSD